MSPLRIKMLLHYHAHAMDYRDEVGAAHACSGAVTEALRDFLEWGLIKETNPGWADQTEACRDSQFSTTSKGAAMVAHLCAVEVPICKWVQPGSPLEGTQNV